MRIVGTKYCGHDSALCLIDTNEKSNILKTLLFPTDMGENFKMMILCDDIDTNLKLPFKDYRHKL